LLVTNLNKKRLPPFDQRQKTFYISIDDCCGTNIATIDMGEKKSQTL
jgi:hypothetical protein